MRKYCLIVIVFVGLTNKSVAQYKYPSAKIVDSADVRFGKIYKDPYRWLEDMKNPEAETWFKEQNTFTNSIVSKISGRDNLIAEWEKLDKLKSTNYFRRRVGGDRIFYQKSVPNESGSKVYYRNKDGKEQFLFDPTNYTPKKNISINQLSPSYDGKKLAVCYVEQGKEISAIIIMDVESKKVLPEIIYPTLGNISWSVDNLGFVYTSLITDDNNSPDFLKNNKIRFHKLGDDVKKDVDFFSAQSYPELNPKEGDHPNSEISESAPNYIFSSFGNDDGLIKYYAAPANQLYAKHVNWKKLSDANDELKKAIDFIGDKVYAISSKNAPNFKLISTSIENPNWNKAEIIAEEKPNLVLDDFTFCKDFLVLTYTDGINNRLFKYNLQTKITSEIKAPLSGVIELFCREKKSNFGYVFISSWNKPNIEYKLDIKTDDFLPSEFNLPDEYPAAYKDIEVEEVEVKGHDGTLIPLSIIYKKGLKKDGNNVCVLESYGSFGMSMTPGFVNTENSLVTKGVIIAMPHVRGGGEKGEAWHKGGLKENKPNSWKDFNSCAEYLIAQKYTSTQKLACIGGSAGGTLIGRVITERPDLYAAAVCDVGVNNTLRLDKMPNGPNIMSEWGNIKDSSEFKYLYELDCIAHVKPNIKYPAVICVTGWNDPRAAPWMSAKFAAALQSSNDTKKPELLRVNFEGDHFSLNNYSVSADTWAFLLWQCGHPDFKLN
jgi:prolyl oligopeptidase